MFGPALLVAPIVRPGGKVRLYLPQGQWRDFGSRETFEGGRAIEVAVPPERFPVFARADAAIPLGAKVQHTGELRPSRAPSP
jgi:alpha-glucosidase (family GH31 glycosyl hydrolase)